MLPSYASSAQREKMNRHGYGGAGGGANGHAHYEGRTFSIDPDKYEKYVCSRRGDTWRGKGREEDM